MKPEDKELLLKDLGARLSYGLKGKCEIDASYDTSFDTIFQLHKFDAILEGIKEGLLFVTPLIEDKDEQEFANEEVADGIDILDFKPYLRPLSSMVEEEARDIAILHGNEPVDILSIKVTDEYINILLDDGVCGTYTETIWYDDIISSIKCFDYLNKKMFDYRRLIPKGLAISTKEFNPYSTD